MIEACVWLGQWAIPALWLLAVGVAWVGVVRHGYRTWRALRDLRLLQARHITGWIGWAAERTLMGELCRTLVKGGLGAFALLRLDVQLDRLDVLAPTWDWRDVEQPLLCLFVLLLLTHWSTWEERHRPRPR